MTEARVLLKEGCSRLMDCGIAEADTDSWLLFSGCTGLSRMDYLLNPRLPVSDADAGRYREMIRRRAEHVPLQYITGEQEFMGLPFKVNPHVLIPRQDTEILVEAVLEQLRREPGREPSVLDMCTGSGCILLSIMAYARCRLGHGADVSGDALAVARENEAVIRRLNRESLPAGGGPDIRWIITDLFENIGGRYDLIVSNPPYIPSGQIPMLMPEVRSHEPLAALDGSTDGLDFYRRIVEAAPEHLFPGGQIFFEIGWDQAEAVGRLLEDGGFCGIHVKKDLAGLDRVVCARLP